MRAAAIIPARDEAAGLGRVLEALPRDYLSEIVVVDNGSKDGTAAVARKGGATVVSEPRAGYGRACLGGIAHLARNPPDVVVFLDADASDDPEELPGLLGPIRAGRADLVIGSRTRGRMEPGAHPPHARAGNWLATRIIRFRYGYRFTDLGPFRAIRWSTLRDLRMADADYGWTVEMQLKAAAARVPSVEVPVSYRKRLGVSKISGSWIGSFVAGVKILSVVLGPASVAGASPRPG